MHGQLRVLVLPEQVQQHLLTQAHQLRLQLLGLWAVGRDAGLVQVGDDERDEALVGHG